jgi:hypothetical protein
MPGDSVLMHHKNPSRDGVYVQPTFTKAAIATLHKDTTFAPTGIQGQVYVQPLFVDGGAGGKDLVIIATQANNVYALDAASGATVWTKNVGTPVPAGSLPCGNIRPTFGITGTPVIDYASQTLYLDAEVVPAGGTNTHQVFALSLADGSVKPGWPVDMAVKAKAGATTFNPPPQSQRGGLLLLNGTLYLAFGGRYGDCGSYHGWVVGISTTNPASVQAWATTAAAGGIWSPAGISTDGTNLFVATGNTSGTSTWGGGEGIISLSPYLTMNSYFAPKNWKSLDDQDLDLGTIPIPFTLAGSTPSALAISFGKDGNAYLVDRNNLGSVSAALSPVNGASCSANSTDECASLHVASNEIISASVLYTTATATYAVAKGNGSACTGGSGDMLAVEITPGSPPKVVPSWCASGGQGSPMVTTSDGQSNFIVWNLGVNGDNKLHAFDGDTGMPVTFTGNTTTISGMRTYNPPIAAKGRIFVPTDSGAVAFKL